MSICNSDEEEMRRVTIVNNVLSILIQRMRGDSNNESIFRYKMYATNQPVVKPDAAACRRSTTQ